MKYTFLHQHIKQIPVQSEYITMELAWQEFSAIVVLLLWAGIPYLGNCWYEIIWNCPEGKNLLKESKITSVYCYFWPLDSVPKFVPIVVCLFVRDKKKSWAQCWSIYQQNSITVSECCSIVVWKFWTSH